MDYQSAMPGFRAAFRRLGGRPARIVETGTSAWGVDSSRLFDTYIRVYGGEFWSVDLRTDPSMVLRGTVSHRTHLHVGDSVDFLQALPQLVGDVPIDLFYLDSYDLDWSDPEPSEQHGLAEWKALEQSAGPGTLVLVDDTPASADWIPRRRWLDQAAASELHRGHLPGKGALIMIEEQGVPAVEKVWHGYNLLLRFK